MKGHDGGAPPKTVLKAPMEKRGSKAKNGARGETTGGKKGKEPEPKGE